MLKATRRGLQFSYYQETIYMWRKVQKWCNVTLSRSTKMYITSVYLLTYILVFGFWFNLLGESGTSNILMGGTSY